MPETHQITNHTQSLPNYPGQNIHLKARPTTPTLKSTRSLSNAESQKRLVRSPGRTHRMVDPFSRPGPERSFPCPRSAVCIIVTNASRPDHPRPGSINSSLWRRGRCRHPHALDIGSLARAGGMSIVMTAPMVDYKMHWLKIMSVPESRAIVGRRDGINGRDNPCVGPVDEGDGPSGRRQAGSPKAPRRTILPP